MERFSLRSSRRKKEKKQQQEDLVKYTGVSFSKEKVPKIMVNRSTGNQNTLLHGSKNPKVMMISAKNAVVQSLNHLYYNNKQGMLEMIHYVFEKWNIGTVIVFNSGSTMSLITTRLAGSLFLKGIEKLLNFLRVGETEPQLMMKKPYALKLKGNNGLTHEV